MAPEQSHTATNRSSSSSDTKRTTRIRQPQLPPPATTGPRTTTSRRPKSSSSGTTFASCTLDTTTHTAPGNGNTNGNTNIYGNSRKNNKLISQLKFTGGWSKERRTALLILNIEPIEEMKATIRMAKDLELELTPNPLEATHVVVGTMTKRTVRLMVALCTTSNILNQAWIKDSHEREKLMPCTYKYKRFDDVNKIGNKFQLSSSSSSSPSSPSSSTMKEILAEGEKRRQEGGLLAGWKILVCEGVAGNKAPSEEELKFMVKAAGGEWLVRLDDNKSDKDGTDEKVMVITSDPALPGQISEERALIAAKNNASFFTISWLFDCMMLQKLNLSLGVKLSDQETSKSLETSVLHQNGDSLIEQQNDSESLEDPSFREDGGSLVQQEDDSESLGTSGIHENDDSPIQLNDSESLENSDLHESDDYPIRQNVSESLGPSDTHENSNLLIQQSGSESFEDLRSHGIINSSIETESLGASGINENVDSPFHKVESQSLENSSVSDNGDYLMQQNDSESLGISGINEIRDPPSQQGDDLFLKGVSVHYLEHIFLQEIQDSGLDVDHATMNDLEADLESDNIGLIRRKGVNVTCPRDGLLGAAYVDAIEQRNDYVGRASIMLSHSRGYNIKSTVVGSVVAKCQADGRDPKRTYVWICSLCNNQHRTSNTEVLFDQFRETLYGTIASVDRLWSILSPWDEPQCLKRTWCIYEIYVASTEPGVEVEIIMPEDQEKDMIESLEDFHKLLDAVSETKIENTETTRENDKRNILDLVEGSVGCHEVNKKIHALYRDWISANLMSVVNQGMLDSDDVNGAKTIFRVGCAFFEMGDFDKAAKHFDQSLAIRMKVLGEEHVDTAMSYNNIALVKYATGDYDGSMEMLEKALVIRQKVLGKNQITANSYNNIAEVKRTKHDYNGALRMHEEALAIRKEVLGEEHIDTALSYNNIALVKFSTGYFNGALSMLEKALAIRLKVLGEEHADTAMSYNNIAEVKEEMGDYDGALQMHKEALAIREKVLGKDHTSTIRSRNNIEKCLKTRERTLGAIYPIVPVTSYKNIETVKNA